MAPAIITVGILCAVIASLVVLFFQASDKARALKNDKKSLETEIGELRAKAKEQAKNYEDSLKRLREYYDEQVEREKKEIAGFHAERHALLRNLILEYERHNMADQLMWDMDGVDARLQEFDEKRGNDRSPKAK